MLCLSFSLKELHTNTVDTVWWLFLGFLERKRSSRSIDRSIGDNVRQNCCMCILRPPARTPGMKNYNCVPLPTCHHCFVRTNHHHEIPRNFPRAVWLLSLESTSKSIDSIGSADRYRFGLAASVRIYVTAKKREAPCRTTTITRDPKISTGWGRH